MELSIVIPVHNEEKNISVLAEKIRKALDGKLEYEVLWVDDGSSDSTKKVLRELAQKDAHNIGIILMRNIGQSGALMAGFDAAKGKYIATLDGDNQNDPDEFPEMIKKLEEEDLDAVIGWRKNRWQGNVIRRIPSLLANKFIQSAFPELNVHDAGCPVKVIKAEIVKNIKLYGELHRFLAYIIGSYGAKMGEVEVKHRKRMAGKSHYGISRTLKVIFDVVNLRFLAERKKTPLIMLGPIALILYFIGGLSAFYLLVGKLFFNIDLTGDPFFIISIMSFMMGTQFVTLGLLGELIIRSYYETGNIKTYAVRKVYSNR
ncbi:glycosyltransferase [Candidatus Dojkabacteria bacterium]|nr:glycosyltransferase [Candidatus Dojkabacteria bacterium]